MPPITPPPDGDARPTARPPLPAITTAAALSLVVLTVAAVLGGPDQAVPAFIAFAVLAPCAWLAELSKGTGLGDLLPKRSGR